MIPFPVNPCLFHRHKGDAQLLSPEQFRTVLLLSARRHEVVDGNRSGAPRRRAVRRRGPGRPFRAIVHGFLYSALSLSLSCDLCLFVPGLPFLCSFCYGLEMMFSDWWSSVPEDCQRVPLLLRVQRHGLLQRDGRLRHPPAVRCHEHLRHTVRRRRQERPLRGKFSLHRPISFHGLGVPSSPS